MKRNFNSIEIHWKNCCCCELKKNWIHKNEEKNNTLKWKLLKRIKKKKSMQNKSKRGKPNIVKRIMKNINNNNCFIVFIHQHRTKKKGKRFSAQVFHKMTRVQVTVNFFFISFHKWELHCAPSVWISQKRNLNEYPE